MVEALGLILVATVVVSGYAVWKSAWGLPPPPPLHADPPKDTAYRDIYVNSELREISRRMQHVIFYGIPPSEDTR